MASDLHDQATVIDKVHLWAKVNLLEIFTWTPCAFRVLSAEMNPGRLPRASADCLENLSYLHGEKECLRELN